LRDLSYKNNHTRLLPPNNCAKQSGDFSTDLPKIRSLLNQIETKAFNGPMNSFEVFRSFDHDKDGYITKDDFVRHVQGKLRITAPEKEIADLFQAIDKNSNGYFEFKEFTKAFNPQSSLSEEFGGEGNVSSLSPSKEAISKKLAN
jgi:hypothetical protein